MIKVVSVDTENGPVMLNQSDLTSAHVLTDPQPDWSALFGHAVAPAAPAAPVAGEPGAPLAPMAPTGEPSATVPPANVDPAANPVAPGAPGEPTPPPAPPAPPEPPAPPVPPAPAPVPVETFVTKLDNSWFITGSDGKAIDGKNGEDGKGYSTKKAAEEANK